MNRGINEWMLAVRSDNNLLNYYGLASFYWSFWLNSSIYYNDIEDATWT